ncbi:hypothetical protein MARPO_0058s0095 [Marchantia polymorpha]|nr:hypothetical protein MARPO_0058s0095 [Marchantia polymorpha]PTQ37323.1 hypothetical protein MARPO_0058s0095 [Marchantia polymorpha]PTQ37324.1 hypothetical protein MARPO_0058s0095 [Marchantia polymorpha]|eukprot:PTQ37322.1 hypothetical protein MARPO_0058s0095 [Marchantia polymorpha]
MKRCFVLFLITQVLVGVLIAIATHTSSWSLDISDHGGWMSTDVQRRLASKASPTLLAQDAMLQLNFTQNEGSWIAQVYHDENFPALKLPNETYNNSVPLTEFCSKRHEVDSSTGSSPQYAVFRNVMLVGRQLLLTASINCSSLPENVTDSLKLKTPYHFGMRSTPELEATVVRDTDNFEDFEPHYTCHERVYEPSVLFSFINWPQHGHALFNGISMLWDAFQHEDTGPLFGAGKNVRLYAYGDGLSKSDRQDWQQYLPFFGVGSLQPIISMFTHQPVRSLANLLMQSDRHPICFTYLLVGITGELDHYNFNVSLSKWRQFAQAVRQHFGVPDTPRITGSRLPPLERLAPSKGVLNNDVSHLPEISPIAWEALPDRPRLVIIDRRDNRVMVNVDELCQIANSTGHFRSTHVVYLEEMSMDEQIRLLGETDVLFGMDGTGLMNGIFMPEGGIVVHVRPYGCAEFLPDKGRNFERLWSAHPGRVIRYESGDIERTRFPAHIKERPELVFNHSSPVAYRMPFILRQDSIIDPAAFRCLLHSSNQLLHGKAVDWQQHNECTKNVYL